MSLSSYISIMLLFKPCGFGNHSLKVLFPVLCALTIDRNALIHSLLASKI